MRLSVIVIRYIAKKRRLKLRSYPEERNMLLLFNWLKLNVVASYHSRSGASGSCHKYCIGKGHFPFCLEMGGFTDNGRAKLIYHGNRSGIVNPPNNSVSQFMAMNSDSVIIDLYEIRGVHA